VVGRLFREFAVVLATAVLVSLVISLTTTPMMAAHILRPENEERHGALSHASERGLKWLYDRYEKSLAWVLDHHRLMLVATIATVAISAYLYLIIPKGFFRSRIPDDLWVRSRRIRIPHFNR
jgi:multidrug efflux pump subunit AcrB